MKKKIKIIKASGESEIFSEKKFRQSLARSGAEPEDIKHILSHIEKDVYDGMSTKELYKLTYSLLKKQKIPAVAGRYHLKQAIMQLGPSGFPFERYLGEVLRKQEYHIQVGKGIPGKCAPSHEIDLIAKKGTQRLLIECKFHNRSGLRSALKTSLYVKARYDDVQDYIKQQKHTKEKFTRCWLVTNTKFTSVAIAYGECSNLKMISWAHPKDKGLESLIDTKGLHPITCLSTLTGKQIRCLLREGIVLCCDLRKNKKLLKNLKLSAEKIDSVLTECGDICKGKSHKKNTHFV